MQSAPVFDTLRQRDHTHIAWVKIKVKKVLVKLEHRCCCATSNHIQALKACASSSHADPFCESENNVRSKRAYSACADACALIVEIILHQKLASVKETKKSKFCKMRILSRLRVFSLLREACTEHRLYRLRQYRFSFRMKRAQVRSQILIEIQRSQIESLLKQKDVAMKNALLTARHKVTQAEMGRLEKLRKIAAEKGVTLPMKTGCESEVVSGIVSQVQRKVDMALRQSDNDDGTGVMTAFDKNKQFAKNAARDAVKYVLDEAQRECNANKRTGMQKMGADFMQGPLLAAQIAKRLGVNDAEMETLLKRLEESEGRHGNSEENSEFANVFKHAIRDAMRHVKASDPNPGTTTAQKNAE